MNFTQKKFGSLPEKVQHKYVMQVLHRLYEQACSGQENTKEMTLYMQLMSWLQLPTIVDFTPELLSNAYHQHAKRVGIFLSEQDFLPNARTGDANRPSSKNLPMHIYLDHIRSAYNVGNILRTAEAFGLGTVYLSPDTPKPNHSSVQKTAKNTEQWIQWEECSDLDALPGPIIALETSDSAIPIEHFIFPEVATVVLGNEEYGCSSAVLKKAEYIVEIPLYGRKNSLNVANAFAIAAQYIRASS